MGFREGNKATVFYFLKQTQPQKEPTHAQTPPISVPVFTLKINAEFCTTTRALGHKCHLYISQMMLFTPLKGQTRVLTQARVWREWKSLHMQLIYFSYLPASIMD